jgi:VWFA-related protein
MKFAVAAAVALTLVAAAQTQAPQDRPTFRTEANYIRVDVYPSRNGQPVTDLTQADFEILEDKAPQKIDQFEHVTVRGNIPNEQRREPNSVGESREMTRDLRARVFVVFLDTGHVDVAGSHRIRQPLIDALNRLIGEDDLVAVMTPDMLPADLTFARRTTTIEGVLAKHWDWGDKDKLVPVDPAERALEACFGLSADTPLTAELIARRREKQTMEALEDLTLYLRDVREERKAIITISNGWLLYTPNFELTKNLKPTPPPIGVTTGGKLKIDDTSRAPNSVSASQCQTDVIALAQLDDQTTFRRILDEANRSNASFYPIDPRGIAVFESPISNPLPLDVDVARTRARAESSSTLANATDGMAVRTNDMEGGFKRIVDDLTSYYLLGYYSTGKVDGKFHSITVRVKRPGVQVRARRGFMSVTAEDVRRAEMKARVTEAKSSSPAADAEADAIEAVLRPLGALTREVSLRLSAVAGWKPNGDGQVWLVGELGAADVWKAGADIDVTMTRNGGPGGDPVVNIAKAHATVAAGTRSYRVALTSSKPLTAGDYTIHVRTVGTSMMSSSNDIVPVQLAAAPDASGAIVIRRGPATAQKDVVTADVRFRRSEQIKIEMPATDAAPPGVRVLDRTGKAFPFALTATVRDDADGTRWDVVQLPLNPFGTGDYIIELSSGSKKTLTPFRIVP